jgi:exopolysaccharide biosynthesis protein
MENNIQKKTYEVKTNEWFIEDETDEVMNIETFIDDKGGKKKRCTLSDGRIAESRKLKGKDSNMIKRITNNDVNKIQDAVTALSTKISDKDIVLEDLQELWFSDYTKLNAMAASLNFM